MFSVERHGETVVVTPQCDLDLASKEAFNACLHHAAKGVDGRVIVSMLSCNYVDSTALNALAGVRRTLQDRLVLVVAPDHHVARVFAITDFKKFVPIFATVDDALAMHVA